MSDPAADPFSVLTRDGVPLAGTRFGAASGPRAVVMASATGVPQQFYRRFAQSLAKDGTTAVTFDYRGVGQSRPADMKRCTWSMEQWGTHDLDAVLSYLAADFSELCVVGHSVGGQVLPLASASSRVARIYLVSVQSGYWGHWSGWGRIMMGALWYLGVPLGTRVFGYAPGFLYGGEDLPPLVVRQWAKWGRAPDYVLSHPGAKEAFAELRAPVRALSIDDDRLAPRGAVDALVQAYGGEVARRHVAPEEVGNAIGHFGFFRSASRSLWGDARRFLDEG